MERKTKTNNKKREVGNRMRMKWKHVHATSSLTRSAYEDCTTEVLYGRLVGNEGGNVGSVGKVGNVNLFDEDEDPIVVAFPGDKVASVLSVEPIVVVCIVDTVVLSTGMATVVVVVVVVVIVVAVVVVVAVVEFRRSAMAEAVSLGLSRPTRAATTLSAYGVVPLSLSRSCCRMTDVFAKQRDKKREGE